MPDTVAPVSAPSQATPSTPQSVPSAAPADPEYDFGEFKMSRSAAAAQLKQTNELRKGAYAKFEESSKMRKDFDAQIADFDRDPEAFFRARGKNFDEIAAKRLMHKMHEQEMSPEQREAAADKLERDALRAKVDEYEKVKVQEQETQATQAHMQHWDTRIAQALAASDLPRTPKTVARAADKLIALAEKGVPIDRIPLEAIVAELRTDLHGELSSVVAAFKDNPAGLRKFLGEDIVKAVNQMSLDAVRNPQKSQTKAPEQRASTDRAKKPADKMNVGSWREHLRTFT